MDMIKEGKLVNSMEPSIVGFFSSTNQPGFIFSKQSSNIKVIGIFEMENII